jgi:cytoskeletal protein CcmA (bactofilin family)
VFRKKKGPGGVQGYDRISRLIEDRQREIGEDGGANGELEEDTIVMRGPASAAGDPDDEESVSLLDVRGRGMESRSPVAQPPHDNAELPGVEPSYAAPSRGDESSSPPYDTPEEDPQQSYAASPPLRTEAMPVPNLAPVGGSSLVAADATWEGKLRSQGDIHVEGIFRGEVDTSATLVVAPQARIHGTVRARNVMLGGDVEGDISCEERLEILPGGSARGQINSGTLVVHEGAYIDSRFQMRQQPAPGS